MSQLNNVNVSIIVPVYGVAKYLDNCIYSLVQQSYESFEIILVDDGSKDGSGDICNDWSKKDSRIKTIHKENGGLSSARNCGINEAKGKYLAFVDADDFVDRYYIETLYNLCIKYNSDLAMCDYMAVDKYIECMPRVKGEVDIKTSGAALHELCCVPYATKYNVAWNKLYKKDLFENLRFPEGKNHEDEFVTYKAILAANKIVITSAYLYYYLKREDSITGVESLKSRKDAIDAFEERGKFLFELGYEAEYRATLNTLEYLRIKYDEINGERLKTKQLLQSSYEVIINDWSNKNNLNQKIVIFGAGEIGMKLFQSLKDRNYSNVSIVDNRWYVGELRSIGVKPLYFMRECKADMIVIAIKNVESQKKINKLLVDWGIDASLIKSVYCKK